MPTTPWCSLGEDQRQRVYVHICVNFWSVLCVYACVGGCECGVCVSCVVCTCEVVSMDLISIWVPQPTVPSRAGLRTEVGITGSQAESPGRRA